jgi:hypothetical protein
MLGLPQVYAERPKPHRVICHGINCLCYLRANTVIQHGRMLRLLRVGAHPKAGGELMLGLPQVDAERPQPHRVIGHGINCLCYLRANT